MGQAIAYAFAAAGCKEIALLDINEEGLKATKSELDHRHSSHTGGVLTKTYKIEVTDATNVAEVFSHVKEDFGSIDYAVNCAGIGTNFRPSTETEIEVFDRINGVNYRGVWLCSREELKIMKMQPLETPANAHMPEFRRQRGAIVNISSSLGLAAMPNSPAYTAAKAGVIGITRADALDYSEHRIRVNAVLPGIVLTPMTNIPGLKEAMEATAVQHGTPMKRWGQPEEIADVVVFLCGSKASFVQGAAWTVDGGYIIQ